MTNLGFALIMPILARRGRQDVHAAAHKAGATEEEVAQTTMIAAALRAGAAFGHGLMAMKFLAQPQAQ